VLIVDDESVVLRAMSRVLSGRAYAVETCSIAPEAVERVARGGIEVVVSDISMPGMSGVELLRRIREHDADLPVVLVTGLPAVESAAEAVEYGAFRYLVKPVEPKELRETVDRAAQLCRLARMKREAFQLLGSHGGATDRAGLEASFERALKKIWIAYQPIIRASDRSIFGYEALLRSDEPSLPGPGQLLDAASRLGALTELGRRIRECVLEPFARLRGVSPMLFVNLHPQDLSDPELLDESLPLAAMADRVVLEITERASLGDIENVRGKVARLRDLGFRIAVDDLGAGYAGLTSFALLEPDIVKIDMTLVRNIDLNPVKQKLVMSMASLCKDMGLLIVAEGVETTAERDTLVTLGCDLFQGYLFARPGRAFPQASWDAELVEASKTDPFPSSGTHRRSEPLKLTSSPPASVQPESAPPLDRFVPLFVIDSLGEGVTLANAHGRIVYSNKTADRILGVSPTSAPPSEWADYYGAFLPDGTAPFPTDQFPLVRALRGEETGEQEILIRNANMPAGVIISAIGRPLRDPNGLIVGASVVFRDVTPLREAEKRLDRTNRDLGRANEELTELHRRQAELGALIVHDLKSPLTGIINAARAIRADPGPEAAREWATLVVDSAQSMQRMVMDLLDVHVGEQGSLEPEREPVDVAELLRSVSDAMLEAVAYRNQRIELSVAPRLPALSADRELLRRVIQNLIDNSIKYAPEAGTIWVEAILGSSDRVVLRVGDEGPRVPETLRGKIFEKYTQIEREASRSRDSRGLGLRFCRLAAEAHGGRIWVEDREPAGVRFCVELPISSSPTSNV
jgi:EAL domain-containing protein (putative c-di-GMP-specific phosphodiesterase class I)/signal transduction histidine kinase/CheY-like chemotaxis protein